MLNGLKHEALLECLLALPPLEIKAVTLHRAYKQTGLMPSKDDLSAAVVQLQAYGSDCRALASSLQKLPAIPALDCDLVRDFSL